MCGNISQENWKFHTLGSGPKMISRRLGRGLIKWKQDAFTSPFASISIWIHYRGHCNYLAEALGSFFAKQLHLPNEFFPFEKCNENVSASPAACLPTRHSINRSNIWRQLVCSHSTCSRVRVHAFRKSSSRPSKNANVNLDPQFISHHHRRVCRVRYLLDYASLPPAQVINQTSNTILILKRWEEKKIQNLLSLARITSTSLWGRNRFFMQIETKDRSDVSSVTLQRFAIQCNNSSNLRTCKRAEVSV